MNAHKSGRLVHTDFLKVGPRDPKTPPPSSYAVLQSPSRQHSCACAAAAGTAAVRLRPSRGGFAAPQHDVLQRGQTQLGASWRLAGASAHRDCLHRQADPTMMRSCHTFEWVTSGSCRAAAPPQIPPPPGQAHHSRCHGCLDFEVKETIQTHKQWLETHTRVCPTSRSGIHLDVLCAPAVFPKKVFAG